MSGWEGRGRTRQFGVGRNAARSVLHIRLARDAACPLLPLLATGRPQDSLFIHHSPPAILCEYTSGLIGATYLIVAHRTSHGSHARSRQGHLYVLQPRGQNPQRHGLTSVSLSVSVLCSSLPPRQADMAQDDRGGRHRAHQQARPQGPHPVPDRCHSP
jgi:hypothetical protein